MALTKSQSIIMKNTYFTKEEKGKTTLLFLHGWGCDNSIFDSVRRQLPYTTIAIDLWGFGKSDNVDIEGWTVEQYADCLYQWVNTQQLHDFIIVAHSFGGRVALVFASKYSHLVSALIITGGAGMRRFSLQRCAKVALYKTKKFLVACGFLSGKCLLHSGSVDYRSAVGSANKNTLVKVVTQDLSPYAKAIACKTLLLWGSQDKETPLWMARRLNRLIKDSFVIEIDGSHFAFVENNVLFSAIVTSWIEGAVLCNM